LIDNFEISVEAGESSASVVEHYREIRYSDVSRIESRYLRISQIFEDAHIESENVQTSGFESPLRNIRIIYDVQEEFTSYLPSLDPTESVNFLRDPVTPENIEERNIQEEIEEEPEPDPEELTNFSSEDIGTGLFKVASIANRDQSIVIRRQNGTQSERLEVPDYVYNRLSEGDIIYFKNNKLEGKRKPFK
jgi:hypothetical protein